MSKENKYDTFEKWYAELFRIAKEQEVEWLLPPVDEYPTDGFEDELLPSEELSDLISYAMEDGA